MNIKQALEHEHSKRTTMAIVNYISANPKAISELMDCLLDNNIHLVQRASWPLSYIAEHQPLLIVPYLPKLIQQLATSKHAAYKRNVYRTLRILPELPENIHAALIDHCIHDISDHTNPAAVRAFAIHIMGRLAKWYPDLRNELQLVLEPLVEHEFPSIKSSARNILKQLHKLN